MRLQNYKQGEAIFTGEHREAFDIRKHALFTEETRYIVANFGGMISRLSADMLFQEFPQIKSENQDFIDGVFEYNNLRTQLYESALENSFRGDAVFRIRAKDGEVLVEDMNPANYYVEGNEYNVNEEPTRHIFFWEYDTDAKDGKTAYRLEEIHEIGKIYHKLYVTERGDKKAQVPLETLFPDLLEEEDTNIDDFLVVHIPNMRINSSRWGISDYQDLYTLFEAINNRLTKISNILDKHGDPILAVPTGVLDDDGKVRKESFGVIEIDGAEAGSQKPEYIVWDAKLESAFSEIDKLIELVFLMSETSKASMGLDKEGQAESGRALKFKLLRTIAKTKRKQLYYNEGIKRMLEIAQKLAIANKLQANGETIRELETVSIEWRDGVVDDEMEELELEERKLDAGLTTKAEAIMRLDNKTEAQAEEKMFAIQEESRSRLRLTNGIAETSRPIEEDNEPEVRADI